MVVHYVPTQTPVDVSKQWSVITRLAVPGSCIWLVIYKWWRLSVLNILTETRTGAWGLVSLSSVQLYINSALHYIFVQPSHIVIWSHSTARKKLSASEKCNHVSWHWSFIDCMSIIIHQSASGTAFRVRALPMSVCHCTELWKYHLCTCVLSESMDLVIVSSVNSKVNHPSVTECVGTFFVQLILVLISWMV